ncbi:MAG: UDP-3-O-(3-hydroxymyristoyl)glucosamine N-acyltransferase [Bacteroidetes bacterium]|nr:UDP-3-O-(3-hydroxymyristoyl)glucosamine N-acyltransferase [Bacteroidota bacterium]
MEFSAAKIAEILNGKVEGDPNVTVSNLAKIEEGLPGTMTFLANPVYTHFIYTTKASVILVNQDFIPNQPVSGTLIRVENAYTAFASILDIFTRRTSEKSGVSLLAAVSKTAKVGEDVYIGEFVCIGKNTVIGKNVRLYANCYIGDNVSIGEETTLHPGVKIYKDTVIGKNCTLHAGVVIGADGFGFAPQSENEYKKILQVGNVVIEDNVEIGSNTTIDRATLGSTRICKGVKLDNLIQVGHGVEIGENTVIAAQTGIAGSTRIGKNCLVGGQVGFAGHLVIGDNVKIGAQSGIEHNVKDGETFFGSPALEISKARRLYVYFRNFDQIIKRIYQIEKLINKKNG